MLRVLVFAVAVAASVVSAAGLMNTTSPACLALDCSDLCNYQGVWINATLTCHCNDFYYTHGSENCGTARKWQCTAMFLHLNFFGAPFAAAHWYLEHYAIAFCQMVFGLCGVSGFLIWWTNRTTERQGSGKERVLFAMGFVWSFWWFIDIFLFYDGHYKDINGFDLYGM